MSIKIDPKKEPFIRVGIVLPEDQQKSITIYLGDFDDYRKFNFTPRNTILLGGRDYASEEVA